jgi:hypothetical protein
MAATGDSRVPEMNHLGARSTSDGVSRPSVEGAYRDVLLATLGYARVRDYRGPDFGDGMSSRLRRALPVEHKWLNIAFQETVKRAPVDVRPLLAVEYRRNVKGISLFAMTNLTVDRLATETAGEWVSDWSGRIGDASDDSGRTGGEWGDVDYRSEARSLVDWLVEHRSEGYSGFCGGYLHPIQYLDGKGEPYDPDVVDTSYAVKALLAASDHDPRYAEIARTAEAFVVEDLNYREVDGGARVDYHAHHPDDAYTLNAGALGARLLVDLYDRFGEPRLRERARKILDYIVARQTDLGGWYYRDPPEASHLSMDNHHNGFIIECLQRYEAVTGEGRYDDALADALAFYRDVLFQPDGAPNFDEHSAYPRDVHAATQGILVFTYDEDFERAARVLDWTLSNMSAGDGRFYFRKHRFHTKRQVLMRWCQAWMAYAIAEYLRCRHLDAPAAGAPSR